jgi:5-methylcytosine-specific restriction enzyme B
MESPEALQEKMVAAAVKRVFHGSLLSGKSAFAPELSAWSPETVADLHARFVDNLDESSDTFLVKLSRQLDKASDEVVTLAAELLFVNLAPLLPAQIGIAKKREILDTVLSWAGREIALPEDLEPALAGFLLGGQGFLNYRWAHLTLLIVLTGNLAGLPRNELEEVLSDPLKFRDVCFATQESLGHQKARAQIHVLLYVMFPDTFLPIASAKHKQDILEAFKTKLSERTDDVDLDLLALRKILEAEVGGPVEFYQPPLLDVWQPASAQYEQRGWLVRGANVDGHDFIPAWLADGYCSTGFAAVPEIPPGAPRPTIQHTVLDALPEATVNQRGQAVAQLYAFLNLMKTGDVVITVNSDEVHVGTVGGPAEYDPSTGLDNARRRPVSWATAQSPLSRSSLSKKIQSQLARPQTVSNISAVAAELAELAGLADAVDETLVEADATYTFELPPITEELAQELLMPLDWLRQTMQELDSRKQLILYGPPGTGKTFLAKRLARHLAGPDRTRIIQFHPSYTYEDFFEGFRPVKGEGGTIAFEVVPGPFKLIAEQARQDPAHPYILIIDEINRANLAKVFGELYFLLEYREDPITTQYSPAEPFELPDNLFVIGTMNTADRSIALIDAAMRRRFAFTRLSPDKPPINGLLRRWLTGQGLPTHPADILDALNAALDDPDLAIGPSYLMSKRIAEPEGLALIWRSQILPLLEDQLHGTGVDVEAEYGLQALPTPTQPSPDPTSNEPQ